MTMQRRHFEFIAEVLRTQVRRLSNLDAPAGSAFNADAVALAFADGLAATNPNFDRVRFLRACGVGE